MDQRSGFLILNPLVIRCIEYLVWLSYGLLNKQTQSASYGKLDASNGVTRADQVSPYIIY